MEKCGFESHLRDQMLYQTSTEEKILKELDDIRKTLDYLKGSNNSFFDTELIACVEGLHLVVSSLAKENYKNND